jgi:HAD superfamily hydrolase (TIGR01509 family)
MDGVIADTSELHFESWRDVLPDYGLKMTEEDHKKTFGMNNKKILTILMGEEPGTELLREISERKEQAFRDIARDKVKPMEGVLDWLERFGEWGCRQAIASSAPYENVETLVESMDLGRHFDALVSGFSLPAKPDPTVYLQAAKQIAVPAENCIVIEDAVVGVEGALNAGMAAIGVTTTHDAEALAEADIVVDRLDALDERSVRSLLEI